jgi:hypothetical protein
VNRSKASKLSKRRSANICRADHSETGPRPQDGIEILNTTMNIPSARRLGSGGGQPTDVFGDQRMGATSRDGVHGNA